MIIRLSGVLLCVAMMGVGCTTSPDSVKLRPLWVDNPQTKYPLRYFLAASGQGDTLQDAQQVAVANLSKIYKSDVRVDESLQERYFELMGDRVRYQEQSEFERHVTIRSGLTLINVQYADSFTDETGRVHALAFQNRAKTAAIYATRLNENNLRACYFVGESERMPPEVEYSALSAAVAVSADSQMLLEQLDIISPRTKKALQMTHEHDALSKRLAAAAGNVSFSVSIRGDIENRVAAALESMMTDLGFVVSADNPTLRMVGEVSFEDVDLKRDGLAFVRHSVQLGILDSSEKVVVSVLEQGREGHVSRSEAKARCIRSIISLGQGSLRTKLRAYFDGLVSRRS